MRGGEIDVPAELGGTEEERKDLKPGLAERNADAGSHGCP
jgi:hypothetical protein